MATTRKKDTATARRRNGSSGSPTAPSQADGGSAGIFFAALSESADALFAASKASSDRAYRLTTAAIADFQLSQRDALLLAQRWAEAPLDLLGWYTAVVETAINAQGRIATGARRWWEELAQAREEAQDAVQRTARANWRAGRAAFGLAGETINVIRRSA